MIGWAGIRASRRKAAPDTPPATWDSSICRTPDARRFRGAAPFGATLRRPRLALSGTDDPQPRDRRLHQRGPRSTSRAIGGRSADADEEDHGASRTGHPAHRSDRCPASTARRTRSPFARPAGPLLHQVLRCAPCAWRSTVERSEAADSSPASPSSRTGEGSHGLLDHGSCLRARRESRSRRRSTMQGASPTIADLAGLIAGTETAHPGPAAATARFYAGWESSPPDWLPEFGRARCAASSTRPRRSPIICSAISRSLSASRFARPISRARSRTRRVPAERRRCGAAPSCSAAAAPRALRQTAGAGSHQPRR